MGWGQRGVARVRGPPLTPKRAYIRGRAIRFLDRIYLMNTRQRIYAHTTADTRSWMAGRRTNERTNGGFVICFLFCSLSLQGSLFSLLLVRAFFLSLFLSQESAITFHSFCTSEERRSSERNLGLAVASSPRSARDARSKSNYLESARSLSLFLYRFRDISFAKPQPGRPIIRDRIRHGILFAGRSSCARPESFESFFRVARKSQTEFCREY